MTIWEEIKTEEDWVRSLDNHAKAIFKELEDANIKSTLNFVAIHIADFRRIKEKWCK